MSDILATTEINIVIRDKDYTIKELKVRDQDKIANWWLDRPMKEFMQQARELNLDKEIQMQTIQFLALERGKRNTLEAFQAGIKDMHGLKLLIFACLQHNAGMTMELIEDFTVDEIGDIFDKIQLIFMQNLSEEERAETEKKIQEIKATIK